MKIGIIVSFFDFRADVRDLIKELQSMGHEVVLFARSGELASIQQQQMPGVVYREIREDISNWRNRLLEYAFLLFKKLPKSRHNYYLMELFKISNAPSSKAKFIGKITLAIQRLGINTVSYDFLIQQLQYSGNTHLDDIDQFIGFTEFPSDYLAARVVKEKKPLKVYVYSWDHPCKHTRFSKAFYYMVWSDCIKNDLLELQHVPAGQVKVVGATQFSYIWDYKQQVYSQASKPFPYPYVYYCCAIGIKELVPQEVAIIKTIAAKLATIQPDWKLVVRPYPVLDAWGMYKTLHAVSNIILDDDYRKNPFPSPKAANDDKYAKIQAARLVLHTGSTIGLEACLLDTPAFLIDFGYGKNRKGLSVYGFIHQYQNEKYLLDRRGGIESLNTLGEMLRTSEMPTHHSQEIAANFPLNSMKHMAMKIIDDTKN